MNLEGKKSKSNFLLFDDLTRIGHLDYTFEHTQNIFSHNVVYLRFFSGLGDDAMKPLLRVSKLLVI